MAQRIYDSIEFVYLLAGLTLIVATLLIAAWGTSVIWPFYIWIGAGSAMRAGGVARIFLRLLCGAEHYS